MKLLNLTENSNIYTSNVYLGTGTWNTLTDINTLIDVGRDVSIIDKINNASTGVGKHKVEQVILTHSHYDHAGILSLVKKEFNCKVFAFSKSLDGVDQILIGGEILKLGDLYSHNDDNEVSKKAIPYYEEAIAMIKTLPNTTLLKSNLKTYLTTLRDLYSKNSQFSNAQQLDGEITKMQRFSFLY